MEAAEAVGVRIKRAAKVESEADAEAQTQAEPAEPMVGDPILALARASRAVRMSLALQARMIDEALRLQRGDAEGGGGDGPTPSLLTVQFVDPDGRAFDPTALRDDDADIDDAPSAAAGLDLDPRERLIEGVGLRRPSERENLHDPIGREPVSEIVAQTFRDLGLTANWPQLSTQAWAQREMASGVVGKPLADFIPSPRWDPELGPPRRPRHRSPSKLSVVSDTFPARTTRFGEPPS